MEQLAVFLLENGADMDKKDMGGRTPSQIATKQELLWLFSYLNKAKSTAMLQSAVRVKRVARRLTGMMREKATNVHFP